MAETTIEWTHGPRGELGYTFNGWIGCEKISPGCDHCYAATQDKFRGWTPEGWGGPRRRTSGANWKLPKRWNDAAAAAGERRRVFCSSLADVFDNQVPEGWRVDLFRLIRDTPHLDWLLLTKRIGNASRLIEETLAIVAAIPEPVPAWPWPNVWLGATVVNQEEADRDIPKLLATPARVKFLSMEPLLGPVDLQRLTLPNDGFMNALSGDIMGGRMPGESLRFYQTPPIDWVIVGGESGPGARPMHPDWARSLRDQCAAAGVPFLMKQWGEWAPAPPTSERPGWDPISGREHLFQDGPEDQHTLMLKVGKKAAGRLLDGVTHDGFPEVRP